MGQFFAKPVVRLKPYRGFESHPRNRSLKIQRQLTRESDFDYTFTSPSSV